MATLTAPPKLAKAVRFNRWDSPWLNPKLLVGMSMVVVVVAMGLLGPLFYDTTRARAAQVPLNLPPYWVHDGKLNGNIKYPLGTESNGRDMLALIITGAPTSLAVGVIAAGVGLLIGCLLGFSAGLLGGWWDDGVRTITDAVLTIPALAVLIVIAAFVSQIEATTMALLLALFAWPGPTRLIRSQVLTLRERGFIRMARLSGSSTLSIMFREMLPNLLPWLAASFAGGVSAAILIASSLEALGLGPSRVPTLGMTIFYALRGAAVLRNMWWWWGFPILTLIIIFTGLFMIATGLDEIANPRLRGVKE